MSGSSSLSTATLPDSERVDIRRFCGYPAYGAGASGFQSWRFFTAYGTLEYRLTNLAASELQVVRQYLNSLYVLEQALPSASSSLDTSEAAAWTRNPAELSERTRLFESWCRRLASFLGVPPGPALMSGASIII